MRNIGEYTVVSEKMDACPHKYAFDIECVSLFLSLFVAMGLYLFGNITKSFFVGIGIIVVPLTIVFATFYITRKYIKCGVSVVLRRVFIDGNNTRDEIIISKNRQFTNDGDSDAQWIIATADEFIAIAQRKIDEEKQRVEITNAEKQECCNKYRSVIEKVK